MNIIRLDISETQSIKKKIAKIKNEISDIRRSVKNISESIDMKVNARANIDNTLAGIIADLQKEYDFLEKCEKLIDKSINEFVDAEKIDHLPKVNYSVSSAGAKRGGAGKSFNNFAADVKVSSISELMSLLSGTHGLVNAAKTNSFIGDMTEFGWSKLKTLEDIVSFAEDGSETLDELSGITINGIDELTDTGIFDVVEYLKDAEKVGELFSGDGDMEDAIDLLGKYGIKKPVKELLKLAGEKGAGASLLADCAFERIKSTTEITAETVLDVYSVMADPNSDWKDYAKCIESVVTMGNRIEMDTAFDIVGSKAQDMVDILDGIGITDFGTQFEEFTGKEGADIVDFYETAASEIGNMFKKFGPSDTATFLAEGVGKLEFEDLIPGISNADVTAGSFGSRGFGYATKLLTNIHSEAENGAIADIENTVAGWTNN